MTGVQTCALPISRSPAKADVERRLCTALVSLGRLDEAEVILTRLASAPDLDEHPHRTLAQLGAVAHARGDFARSLSLSRAALDAARAAGDIAAIGKAGGQVAGALASVGRSEEATQVLSLLLDEQPADGDPLTRIPIIIELAIAHVWSDRLESARRWFLVARDEAAAIGHVGIVAFCDAWLGGVLVFEGEAAAGRDLLVDADARLSDSGREGARTWVKMMLADAYLRSGDLVDADRVASEGLAIAERHHYADDIELMRLTRARIAAEEGRVADAVPILEDVAASAAPGARIHAMEILGVIARDDGDPETARRHWEEAIALQPAPLLIRFLTQRLATLDS